MNTQTPPPRRSEGSSGLEFALDSVPSAGSAARRQLDGLAGPLSALSFDELRIVVTELVNNSVRHGSGGPITVAVEVTPDGKTRGTVGDGGRGPVEIVAPRDLGDGGLGLRIVDALAAHWGVNAPSSDVWFELAPVSVS